MARPKEGGKTVVYSNFTDTVPTTSIIHTDILCTYSRSKKVVINKCSQCSQVIVSVIIHVQYMYMYMRV